MKCFGNVNLTLELYLPVLQAFELFYGLKI